MEHYHPGSPSVKKFKTVQSTKICHAHHLLGCKGPALHGISDWRIEGEFRQVLCKLKITQATHPQNQAGKKHVSFASGQRKATLQCTNLGLHDKTEIYSGFTPSLQPRFGTVRFLIVPRMEGDVKRSTFFYWMPKLRQLCASGSAANPKTFFMDGMNKWIEWLKKCVAVNGDYVEK